MHAYSRHRRLVAATTLAVTLAAPAAVVTAQGLADRAQAGTPGSAPSSTRVVLHVSGCEGCRLAAHSLLATSGGGQPSGWQSGSKRVRDGKVTFAVPTSRTTGLSFSLLAPFEGATGAISAVVLGYRGLEPGDSVSPDQAAAARKGSVCFAGTDASRLTVDVAVVPVQIEGNPTGTTVTAAAAFATTTQRTLRPYRRTFSGYTGSQDVPTCIES